MNIPKSNGLTSHSLTRRLTLQEMSGLSRLAGVLAVLLAMSTVSTAQTLTTLAGFNLNDGAYPQSGSLTLGGNGNYYGTTLSGGTVGAGTVFEITTSGTLTTIYNFCSHSGCVDGRSPYSGLVSGPGGILYGTTSDGGLHGAGTIFSVSPQNTLTTLYSFCSQTGCADGYLPQAGLAVATDETLYGTTNGGGANGNGTIYSFTTAGVLTTLYNFCSQTNCNDGFSVQSPMIFASNGGLYGTTFEGGTHGWGTVFAITTAGKLTTLHSFSFKDGANPWGGPVQANDGFLYGTTSAGGRSGNGTIFKISETGKFTTIYKFCAKAYCADGISPLATLIQGTSGSLYGTTQEGGVGFLGTVFQVTPAGVLTTLHSFAGSDGAFPYAGVVQNSNGNLYGTTIGTTYQFGNSVCTKQPNGCGTVFSLTP